MARLKSICRIIVDGDWIESKDQSESGIRLIQTGNIGIGEYLDKSNRAKYITAETFERLKCTEVFPGDILISRLPDPIGRACAVPQNVGKAITAVDCTIVRLDSSVCDINYFINYTQSARYSNELSKYLAGTTRTRISRKNLEKIEIPLPSLEEQRRIAAVLDKVSELIAKRQTQLDKLGLLVKARFVEMFGDPVLNPMKWPEQSLENMADIVSGITKGRKTKEIELMEVPYMAVSNVKDGYIDWTTVKTILATKAEIEQYRLLPDDVLMTEGGDPDKLGRGAIIRQPLENCIHQNHIFRVRLDESVLLPSYFAEFLQHQKAKQYFLKCAKQTTGIASINMRQLKGLPILVPSQEIQLKFANFVRRVDQSKLTIQQSLDKLKVLKKALMQQYFG